MSEAPAKKIRRKKHFYKTTWIRSDKLLDEAPWLKPAEHDFCIVGYRQPTPAEAEKFIGNIMYDRLFDEVSCVQEISKEEALCDFQMDNWRNQKVFGSAEQAINRDEYADSFGRRYQAALKHFAFDANGAEHIEGINEEELIFCYEHGADLMDFDCWCRYQVLCGEKITFDEYLAINAQFDGDPHDVDESDLDTISNFRRDLENYRLSVAKDLNPPTQKQNLDDLIHHAAVEAAATQTKEFTFEPQDYEQAKAALFSSGRDVMNWSNDGYACRLERYGESDIYYDLHILSPSGTTIMYGETVELLGVENNLAFIRVPNDAHDRTSINKEFFNKNFTPCATHSREDRFLQGDRQ